MSTWDSNYLLNAFNRQTGRPKVDAIDNPSKFQRLSEAQQEIIADIAAICPHILYPTVAYSALPTLTTTDHQVFRFLAADGTTVVTPMGKAKIFTALNNIPSCPWVEGIDYISMGSAIRIPNNNSYNGPLWWYGITPPTDITSSAQPSLFPEASRELIAIRATYNFGIEGIHNAGLSEAAAQRYGYPLVRDPGRFAFWLAQWRQQFNSGGGAGITGLQFALAGYGNANGFGNILQAQAG